MNNELHVVLGAGQIGSRLSKLLLAKGHRVRIIQRSKPSASVANLEHMAGDITDLGFAEQATRGASVVYDCMNPPYHLWPEQLLAMGCGAVHGASCAGAKLVALDCLYMYGRPNGPLTENAPLTPCSKKGVLRVELANMRLTAHRQGKVPVAIGRASDFFGPNLQFSAWGDRFFQRIHAGQAAECMGDPDMPHAYTYADDVARGLVTLGERSEALGRVWHLPTNPAESTRSLAKKLGAALGLDVKTKRVPKLLLRGIGLFDPFMREVVEMTYQWEMPFAVDDSAFRQAFGYGATPVAEQVAATAAWARGRFGAGAGQPAFAK